MGQLDRLRDRRRAMWNAAGKRWIERNKAREDGRREVSLVGPGGADSPMRNERMRARESVLKQGAVLRARGKLPLFLERKIGATLDFFTGPPTEAARRAGRPVARIVDHFEANVVHNGFGTGFLVMPNLLMTNWHVLPSEGDARGTGANFLYERGDNGVGVGTTFEIDPDTFFLSDEALDYTIVAIKPKSIEGTAAADLGVVTLVEATPKILIGQPVNIIQHPEGHEKTYATTNNRLVDILSAGFIHYETDTLEGSSGSPVFSEKWELVGLHHAGVPEMRGRDVVAVGGGVWNEDMGDDAVHWIANEGVRVSTIVQSLTTKGMLDAAKNKMLGDLLASTTDPVDELTPLIVAPDAAPSSNEAIPAIHPAAATIAIGGQTMSHHFTFTGPVTINVLAPAAPAPQAAQTTTTTNAVGVEKTIRFDRHYENREGYSDDFLGRGVKVPKPTVADSRDGEILKRKGKPYELDYHHFTLVMNESRRLQMWSAVNVDYDPQKRGGTRASFGTDKWVSDPRIPDAAQIMDSEIYKPAHQIDCGHVVRRDDNAWGDSDSEIEFSNSDTFHWTNCTPQHQAFNRENPGTEYGKKGIWGDFEKYIQKELLSGGDTKACILAGPVLAEDDPTADFGSGDVQYPIKFWKVVVVAAKADGGPWAPKAYGFVLSQKDVVDKFGIEKFEPGRFAKNQKSLAEITELTGVEFGDLNAADTKAA